MSRRTRGVLAILALLTCPAGVHAYLKLGADIDGRLVALQWNAFPIRYFVTNRDVPGVNAPALQTAVARAFATWASVPRATVSSEFVGFADIEPFVDDNVSVIGFQPRPELDRTLAATTFTLDTVTGAVLESDIFVNSAFNWSVVTAGETGRHDVESIMVHEIGHLLGLGHSALGETELLGPARRSVLAKGAAMFPIAFPAGSVRDRVVQPDDKAGLMDVYGGSAFRRDLGSIGGRVTMNGQGVFGAHVVAFNPKTQESIGTFSLTGGGSFVIGGLPPGVYVVRVEPIDDADVASFFEDESLVQLNFRPAYFERLVAVPAGGAGRDVEIRVQPK